MRVVVASVALALSCVAPADIPPPKSIPELRSLEPNVNLDHISDFYGGEGFSASLFRYESAGLKVHAMVATPDTPPPECGFPVLVFNHGFHPDPPAYGIGKDGRDHRPGDYYRKIPELYVKHGYLVVIPDYRGHSNSEGVEFTDTLLDSSFYTEDVVMLLDGLDDIPLANPDRVFMMGHSMGGDVTLRALLSSTRVRAAALWSTLGGNLWDQAYYYSRSEDPYADDSSDLEKDVVSRLKNDIAGLDGPFDPERVDPNQFINELEVPLILHHSIDDRGTAFKWSLQIAKALYMNDKTYQLYSYAGDAHLFADSDLELAAERDAAFFTLFDATAPAPCT